MSNLQWLTNVGIPQEDQVEKVLLDKGMYFNILEPEQNELILLLKNPSTVDPAFNAIISTYDQADCDNLYELMQDKKYALILVNP